MSKVINVTKTIPDTRVVKGGQSFQIYKGKDQVAITVGKVGGSGGPRYQGKMVINLKGGK